MTAAGREPIVLACASDAHYIKPLATMLQSVVTNLAPDRTVAIYILNGDARPPLGADLSRNWAPGRASVHWLTIDPSVYTGAPLWGRMSASTYFKLAVPDALPAEVSKAIWLDCDLLVNADLGQLWDVALEGNHVRAVQDSIVPLVSSRYGIASYEQLGIPREAKYFNAGVMVVDVDRWRTERIQERVLEYVRRFGDSVFFWDQEGLNAVLAGSWGELDPRWNRNVSIPPRLRVSHAHRDRTTASDGEPWIIHFAGNLKPWLFPGNDPERLQYYRYLDMTPWAGWRPPLRIVRLLVEQYESSGLRNSLYPVEQWMMRAIRLVSRRRITAR